MVRSLRWHDSQLGQNEAFVWLQEGQQDGDWLLGRLVVQQNLECQARRNRSKAQEDNSDLKVTLGMQSH